MMAAVLFLNAVIGIFGLCLMILAYSLYKKEVESGERETVCADIPYCSGACILRVQGKCPIQLRQY